MFGTIINTDSKRLFHSIFCTFLPTLGTPPTIAAPCFLNKPAITNIVGYQTFATTKNAYTLKSIQFDGVQKSFNINDLTGNLVGPEWDDADVFKSTAPILEVRNGNVYDIYYFLSNGKEDGTPGWTDVGGDYLPVGGIEIPAGTAFWLIDQYSDQSMLTTSGEVVNDAEVTINFTTGYNLAGSPYPMAFALSEITFTGFDNAPAWDDQDAFKATAPMLEVRNGDVYDIYYYLSDGKSDGTPGWTDVGGDYLPDYDAKVIGSGTAFWLVLRNGETNVSATFSK